MALTRIAILLNEYLFLIFSILSEIPIASSLPFLKQFKVTKSPSSIVALRVFPTLFWLFEIRLDATERIFCVDL